MFRLLLRKILLMLLFLPLLNAIGFLYALVHPRLFFSPTGGTVETSTASYTEYVRGLLAGNLGQVGNQTVIEIIADPVKNSMMLVGIALAVAIIFGLLLGLLSISPRTKRMSPQSLVILSAGSSMPGFLFGGLMLSFMIYQTLYAGRPRTLLPISGYGVDEHLVLPVLILALQPMMYIAKVTANLMENELQQDYVRVARSKGLSWIRLLWSHALPNMIAPVLLTIGESLRLMVGALVIVEAIFIWPGIGRIFLFTIGLRLDARPPSVYFGNPYLLASIAVILGALLLLADLVANVLAYRLDPRLVQTGNHS
ncbi:MAG: ABC transporter permease [Chloroflexi bacterium]|nr:MAG: ABC transporter permease [Chloroflexota bacterium]